ncbi:unnamed protein product [Pleuronectes platessa]|uniref:Uncharacterized protein n=1 Tax=Pleuronectes platessa TaxID=8262 RepID=A0A9N7YMS4_PLEPL|nr:unnamed protein product [Pleuronectes platessa]
MESCHGCWELRRPARCHTCFHRVSNFMTPKKHLAYSGAATDGGCDIGTRDACFFIEELIAAPSLHRDPGRTLTSANINRSFPEFSNPPSPANRWHVQVTHRGSARAAGEAGRPSPIDLAPSGMSLAYGRTPEKTHTDNKNMQTPREEAAVEPPCIELAVLTAAKRSNWPMGLNARPSGRRRKRSRYRRRREAFKRWRDKGDILNTFSEEGRWEGERNSNSQLDARGMSQTLTACRKKVRQSQDVGRRDVRRLVSVTRLKGAIRFVADYLCGGGFAGTNLPDGAPAVPVGVLHWVYTSAQLGGSDAFMLCKPPLSVQDAAAAQSLPAGCKP